MILDNPRALIEAILFVSEAPLALDQIKHVVGGFDTTQLRAMIEELNAGYEQHNRGLRIIEVAGGFRMVTPPALSSFLKKLYKEKRVERLSKPALETLAIIAYKQPVTRLEIESLRNVNVDHLVNSLLEKEFIHITGVKKAPGNPKVYGTTKQFLEYFGLRSLEDLPKMEDFSRMVQEQLAKEEQVAHDLQAAAAAKDAGGADESLAAAPDAGAQSAPAAGTDNVGQAMPQDTENANEPKETAPAN